MRRDSPDPLSALISQPSGICGRPSDQFHQSPEGCFREKRCSRLFLSKPFSLSSRWSPLNSRRKYLLEKVIPFVDIEFLDLSQFCLGHELFDVPVLQTVGFTQ